MRIIQDDLQLCDDCLFAAVNGDAPEDETRARAVEAGLERIGPNLVPDFDSETGAGCDEFSWRSCDCCGSNHGGGRHRFAVLGEGVEVEPDSDAAAADDDDDDDDDDTSTGYVDCPCCDETLIGKPGELCDSCAHAGCEPSEDEDGPVYSNCQIPRCPDCDTEASYMNDHKWHSNCDAGCAYAGKAWV